MTTMEFVKKYGVKPSHICNADIISLIYLGSIFVHSETKDANEFALVVFPPPEQRFPDEAALGKAVSAGLKLHQVSDDGAFIYLFNPANEEQAHTAIELAGLDRCSFSETGLPGLDAFEDRSEPSGNGGGAA